MSIENQISEKLWNVIKDNYNTGNYTSAIFRSLLFYSEIVREKSELQSDGTKLMQNAFSNKNPKIAVTDCVTKNDINIQDGYREISTGLIKMIRNPRAHSMKKDTKEDADKIILFIDFMLTFIVDFKKPDVVVEWVDFILEAHFNICEGYADTVFKEIDYRKRLDVLVGIIRKYEKIESVRDIRFILSKLFLGLKEKEKEEFIESINKILLKLGAEDSLKNLFFLLPKEVWKSLGLLSKGRISGILLEAVEKAEANFIFEDIEDLNFEANLCISAKEVFFDIVSIDDYEICIEKIFTSDKDESMTLSFLKDHFLFSFENIDRSFFRNIYSEKLFTKNLNEDLRFIVEKYGQITPEDEEILISMYNDKNNK